MLTNELEEYTDLDFEDESVSDGEDENNIDWSEEDNYVAFDVQHTVASSDNIHSDDNATDLAGLSSSESVRNEPIKAKSISYHLGILKDKIQSKEERNSYIKCLKEINVDYQPYYQNPERRKPLINNYNYDLYILDETPEHNMARKRLLVLEAPIISTLNHVFEFIPELDKKNKIIAWLMHPGHTKQLVHLFKSAFSSDLFWNKVIGKARKGICDNIKIPQGSNHETIIPIIPANNEKRKRTYDPHEICPFYHDKKLCSYRITDLKSPIKNILDKYGISGTSKYENVEQLKEQARRVFPRSGQQNVASVSSQNANSVSKSKKKKKRRRR